MSNLGCSIGKNLVFGSVALVFASCASTLGVKDIGVKVDLDALEEECRTFQVNDERAIGRFGALVSKNTSARSITIDSLRRQVWIPWQSRHWLICDPDSTLGPEIHGPDIHGPRRTLPLRPSLFLYEPQKSECAK